MLDTNTTVPEIDLYDTIEQWQIETKATKETEGNPYDTTSCFSLLFTMMEYKGISMFGFQCMLFC